ncbi:LamG-like jellyroll fold domain-containing protein [Pseudotamlana agarivorans]|uniref:LamG-like jellyroll fold domain-containing protein n=1 Tax=Pseudotamlana agarivorans TaxID=481183 RepID=UPI00082E60F2|nr:LamG-like jellyroll fold domain-containing protein [Tamlana agarivorans]
MAKFYSQFHRALFVALFFFVGSVGLVHAQCVPTNMGYTNQKGISNFTIIGDSGSEINHNSGVQEGYADYTSEKVNVTTGNTYNFSATNSVKNGTPTASMGIWIDYDGTGNFELVYDSGETSNNYNFSGSITLDKFVSNTAVMRVAAVYCYNNASCKTIPATPCDFNNELSEVEDYTLNISLPPIPVVNDDDLTVFLNSTSGTTNKINVTSNDVLSSHGGTGDDYKILNETSHGSLTEITDGIFEYIPNPDYMGTDSFTYSLCDVNNNCSIGTVNILVKPDTCTPTSTSEMHRYIDNVTLTGKTITLNNTSGDNGGYKSFFNLSPVDLIADINYNISITVRGHQPNYAKDVFIDYNRDGDFDDSNEYVATGSGDEGLNFTIPTSVVSGNTVMRVGTRDKWNSTANSCSQYASGKYEEFEDYFINITSSTPTPDPSPAPTPSDPTVYPDTDGDGITDNIDLDDDNDGILDTVENNICKSNPSASKAETVFLYETFGAGTNRVEIDANFAAASTTYEYLASGDVVDGKYTVYHNARDIASWSAGYWYQGDDYTPNDTNGRMAIFNAENVAGGVFYENQISGVTPDVEVTYSFAVINLDREEHDPPRSKPNVLMQILSSDGTKILAEDSTKDIEPSDSVSWEVFYLSFFPKTSDFMVRLINQSVGGLGNDLAIDDIRVVQLFCDSDGDGVADVLDIDDDHDGIPNVVELGKASLDTDKDATLLGDNWIDSNTNGVHDDFESGGTNHIDITNLTPGTDFDGDGVPNYLDLDSDNDGVFDALEYDGLGDIDITGNGVGDGIDSDGDGVLDNIDNYVGFGVASYASPVETTSGTPDYLNPKSGGINDIPEIFAHLDADNDGVIDGSTDADKDGILDAFDTDTAVFGSPRALNGSFALYFDGRNDYVAEPSFMSSWAEATLMCWIKIDPSATGTRFIMGQDNFYMQLDSNNNLIASGGGKTITSDEPLATGVWIHVTARFGDHLWLYTNGNFSADKVSASGGLAASTSSFSIGRTPDSNSNYFMGEIDEVRVFNEAIYSSPIRKMIYQELDETDLNQGQIIPKQINSNLSSGLQRYYKLDDFQDDKLKDHSLNNSAVATIYNVKDIMGQTAPLPFETMANGDWGSKSTWLHGDVWDIDDEANINEWVIVNVAHEVTTSYSHTTLGLIVDENARLDVLNDSDLNNTWYLELNGDIDLHGESQLIQTKDSDLVAGTQGALEVDQQGETSQHNYNYWSSPVHSSNPNSAVDGDESYTVASVLMDGSDEYNPKPISFIGGYDGVKTDTSISIAEYWIWKYANNKSDTYALWQHMKSTGEMFVGEGYTMKGPGAKGSKPEQNYTFKGVPNNGEITLKIHPGNEYLVGNPYPSAIDAHEFLEDNQSALDGTLYFWEHYGGNSHYSKDYEGGYGVYNYSGGTPAMTGTAAAAAPSHSASPEKTPHRYIPVGQGFFVKADTATEADIVFENDQRIFVTESTNTSVFVKNASTKTSKQEGSKNEDLRPKIRINYESPKGYVRQLLTTVDDHATMGVDWGYDGLINETNIEDMYWEVENADYVIQGIDAITEQTVLPLTVKTKSGGLIEISIHALENLPDDVPVYLKDYDTFHDLKAGSFFVNVDSGLISDRFAIAFSTEGNTLDIVEENIQSLGLFYNKQSSSIIINNPNSMNIEGLKAVNMLGQMVFEYPVHASDTKISLPTSLASGVYVCSMIVDGTEVSKKIVISE